MSTLEQLIPLCPSCHDDVAVYCIECGNDYIGCTCRTESDEWYCMKCDTDFQLDLEGYEFADYDETDFAKTAFQGDDGRWYWDDGTEAKCYCYIPKKLLCRACDVSRPVESAHWNPWVEINVEESTSTPASYSYSFGYGADYLGKCNHQVVPVLLNEVTVYASSLNDRRITDIPDFGLYADWMWNPWWRNEHIDWKDYGMPTDYDVAFEQISDAYEKAKRGLIVEIGCIGGHGRTGTILACMAVLDGMQPNEAVKHIESKYCHLVIETNDQEWFVHWFDAKLHGKPEPAKKADPIQITQTACTIADHYAMLKGGLDKCKFGDCKTYDLDRDRYLAGYQPMTKSIEQIAEEAIKNEKKYEIGSVKDGYIYTMDGWSPLYQPTDA